VNRTKQFIIYFILIVGFVVTIIPFLWMISSSFKDVGEIFDYPPSFIPSTPKPSNYIDLFVEWGFLRPVLNSSFVASIVTFSAVFLSALGGFGFAKYEFKLKKPLFYILIGSIMIPFQVLIIPLFILMRVFGWLDTYYALTVPFLVNGFGVFLMRQYIVTIPTPIIEAARLDGCSEFRIFSQIILPLARPALGALTIITFMSMWNSFVWPLIALQSSSKFTIPIFLSNMVSGYRGNQYYGVILAGSVLAVLPVVSLFLAMQKQYLSGLTLGATKM